MPHFFNAVGVLYPVTAHAEDNDKDTQNDEANMKKMIRSFDFHFYIAEEAFLFPAEIVLKNNSMSKSGVCQQ